MKYNILPAPKLLLEENGAVFNTQECAIILPYNCDKRVVRAAAELKNLLEIADDTFHKLVLEGEAEKAINVTLNSELGAEAYNIFINESGILLEGGDAAGQFYAIVTLKQLVSAYKNELPAIIVKDSPDMKHRGHYLDATRGRVQSVEGVMRIVDRLVEYKINSFQLYVEHTFDFYEFGYENRTYEDFFTAEDILAIDEYCMDRFIDFIPSLSTFGHLYELLSREQYKHLCELDNYQDTKHFWYERMAHHTINPSDDESFELICSLIDQYLPLFSSEYFNICCDETFDLCRGKNQGKDRGKLYCEFVNKIIAHITAKGKKVMMWGDIALEHPEALELIPEDTIFLNWDYWKEPNISRIECIKEHGRKQIVCPGVSTWSRLIENPQMSFPNIVGMARGGYDNGALGLLNTNWGDHGHPCHFECSLYGVAVGGAVAWNIDSEFGEEFELALSKHTYGCEENIIPIIRELSAAHSTANWMKLIEWNLNRDKEIFEFDNDEILKNILVCKAASEKLNNMEIKDDAQIFLINSADGIALLNEAIYLIKTDGDSADWKQRTEEWLSAYENLWLIWDKQSELYEIRSFFERFFA